jgi:hypothetical protein
MSASDLPVTDLQRRLLIAEARKWLGGAPIADPSDGVGHDGLAAGDPGLGGPEGQGHGGVGRDGGSSSMPPEGSDQARALAERILVILGER